MASNRPSHIPVSRSSSKIPIPFNQRPNVFHPVSNIPSTVNSKALNSTVKRPTNNFNRLNIPSTVNSKGFHSTVKRPNNNFNLFNGTNISSVVKSASKANDIRSSNMGFNSVLANKNSQKFFGMTPQTNRLSFSQNVQSARLSRSSMSSRQSLKDNRMLTDAAYQKECQERILNFLNTNGYPIQITRQNLARLSLSEASRIFQFLFSFLCEDVVIKNGPSTSLDVVVPKMMSLFGYPYPIKKSDLTSFSGGRQLGSVLTMMNYMVNFITYSLNIDLERANAPDFITYDDDDDVDVSKILPKLLDLLNQIDFEKWSEEKEQRIEKLGEKFYGTEHELSELSKEVENLEQAYSQYKAELSYFSELPEKKQELANEIDNLQRYIKEMIEHIKANLTIKNKLIEDINQEKKILEKRIAENKKLEGEVNAQKDIRIEYKNAIDRKKQIQDEIEQVQLQIKKIEELSSSLNREINKEKSKLKALVTDFEEMISLLFNSYENSKIHHFLPNPIDFEKDIEWQDFLEKLAQMKSLSDFNIEETIFKELEDLTMKKFKELKMHMLEQMAKAKTTISLEVFFKLKDRQKQRDQLKQKYLELESQSQDLWKKKDQIEEQHRTEKAMLDSQIESLKQKILEHEKFMNMVRSSSKENEERLKQKQDEISDKKRLILGELNQKLLNHQKREKDLSSKISFYHGRLLDQNIKLEEVLKNLQRKK